MLNKNYIVTIRNIDCVDTQRAAPRKIHRIDLLSLFCLTCYIKCHGARVPHVLAILSASGRPTPENFGMRARTGLLRVSLFKVSIVVYTYVAIRI